MEEKTNQIGAILGIAFVIACIISHVVKNSNDYTSPDYINFVNKFLKKVELSKTA